MDKQYKEWLQEQTFETLAADNYNTKLLLLTEQAKNKKLVEALEKIKTYKNNCYIFKVDNDKHYVEFEYIWEVSNIAQQELKEVNNVWLCPIPKQLC